jgi:predicted RecB family nuclease
MPDSARDAFTAIAPWTRHRRLPTLALMRRITGTTIYAYATCPRAADLDLHEERSNRRPLTAAEELVRQRGRELEALRTADLGYAEPSFAKGDYAEGARQTVAAMREGVVGITQGVLLEGDLLGIPDLLRKEAGRSALGDFHYVVGDVKSSTAARADQVLQVAFYARLLTRVQERAPEYGFLWLKDGREQCFPLADVMPVLDDVLERVTLLASASAARERPFWSAACRRCHWSTLCGDELRARGDLSLLDGMTRGLRTTLEQIGVTTPSELVAAALERLTKRAHLESALARRLHLAARAACQREPLAANDGGEAMRFEQPAIVHALVDGFAERLLAIGARWHDGPRLRECVLVPTTREQEWPLFQELLTALPANAQLLHWGSALPAWFARASHAHIGDVDLHGRLVDLARRVRAHVAFPGPVFALRDAVAHGLSRDPDRAGDADAVALWTAEPEAAARLAAKLRQDLDDLAELKQRFLG